MSKVLTLTFGSKNTLMLVFAVGIICMSAPVWAMLLINAPTLPRALGWLMSLLPGEQDDTFGFIRFLMVLSLALMTLGAVVSTYTGILLFKKIGQSIEKQKAQEKIRESQERYNLLFSTDKDAILLVRNGDHRIIDANETALSLYGYSRDEILKLDLQKVFETDISCMTVVGGARENAFPDLSGETIHRSRDGQRIPVDISIGHFSSGEELFLCLIIRDIRARRELEEQVLHIGNEERNRIGRDLHDGLGQELTAAALTSKVIENKLRAKGIPESEEVRKLTELMNQTIASTRAIARGLAPVFIEKLGLHAALIDLLDTVEKQSGIATCLSWDGSVNIPEPMQATHLYRIVQEALSNAIRHSHASQIDVSLSTVDDGKPEYQLSISDNGRGIPAERKNQIGLGLKTLYYRASIIGGQMDIQSTPGNGTRIICSFIPHKTKKVTL